MQRINDDHERKAASDCRTQGKSAYANLPLRTVCANLVWICLIKRAERGSQATRILPSTKQSKSNHQWKKILSRYDSIKLRVFAKKMNRNNVLKSHRQIVISYTTATMAPTIIVVTIESCASSHAFFSSKYLIATQWFLATWARNLSHLERHTHFSYISRRIRSMGRL